MANEKTPEQLEEIKRFEEYNQILNYFEKKTPIEWTPEQKVEDDLKGRIHYYHVRQALGFLAESGHLDYSRNLNQYKLSASGRVFAVSGGYEIEK